VTGCGGGGDDSTAARTDAQLPDLTSPTRSGSDATHPDGDTGTGTATAPIETAPGVKSLTTVLAPFRACLTQHGVQPRQFGSPPQQRPDRAQIQKEIQARIACIPELPPKLRKAAERLKSRYEQRQQQG
jgi:hypothetical protein